MNKLLMWWLSLISKLHDRVWLPLWSNIRWQGSPEKDQELSAQDHVTDLASLYTVMRNLYAHFTWTADGGDQLLDAIIPPPQGYQQYLNGLLQDDCDGFHSTLYHMVAKSGWTCALLTVQAIGGGHCVLLCNIENKWRVCDYTCVYPEFATANEAVSHYNSVFPVMYFTKSEVFCNSFLQYDYHTGKLHSISLEDLEK